MSVIPGTREAEVERSQSEALCNNAIPYLKKKLKQKELGHGSCGRTLA
jgi:hypothetical protein